MAIGRKLVTFALVVGVLVVGGGFATAATSGTQTVSYAITTTRSISVAPDTIAFGTNAATDTEEIAAGTATDNITWSTNSSSDKITVQVAALTTGVNLDVKGDAVDDGTPACSGTDEGTLAAGADTYVTDIETERTFVQGIVNCTSGTEPNIDVVTYRLVSTAALGVSSASYTVTYTIKAT